MIGFLHLGGRAPEGSDRAPIPHRDVTVGVHDLIQERDEVTRSRRSGRRAAQPT